MDRVGVDHRHLIADEGFARQQHRFGDECRIEFGVRERLPHRFDDCVVIAVAGRHGFDQRVEHKLLHRLVARERVIVPRREEGEVSGGTVGLDDHRRGEVAIDRKHRPLADAVEDDLLPLVLQQHEPVGKLFPGQLAEQRQLERYPHWLLGGLAGRYRHILLKRQMRAALARLVRQRSADTGRARLAVPEAEFGKVLAARILLSGDEILAGRRGAVVPIEVEIAAGAEPVGAEDGVEHPDHLGALVVHRCRVEVGDLDITFGPDRVRERPAILRELRRTERAHVLDPLDRSRSLVGGELLVAKDGEAFLEA